MGSKKKILSKLLREEYRPWVESLSDRELYAIRKYTWNSFETVQKKFYEKLNAMLRGVLSEENEMLKSYADLISGAMGKHQIQRDIVVYRGSGYDITHGRKVGDIYIDQQFVSTTIDKRKVFMKEYLYVIHIPKGSQVAYLESVSRYPRQQEILINRDTAYKIVACNGKVIELEVIVND